MTLTASQCYDVIQHTLGGTPNARIPRQMILNHAGEHFYSMFKWNWRKNREALLDLRGKITFSDATWTESTKTLTSTGTFASYTFIDDDRVEITGGTGVTTGFYEVASRTDDDDIVLANSISTAGVNLGTGDIEGEMRLDTVTLPTDFGNIISISATDTIFFEIRMVTIAEMQRHRTSQVDVTSNWNYIAAVTYKGNSRTPLLEIWPTPTSNRVGAWTIFYDAKWVRLDDDQDEVPVPDFCELPFLEVVKEVARGYMREDVATMSQRLQDLEASSLFRVAKKEDGRTQPFYGPLRGGGASMFGRGSGARINYLPNAVAPPS